MRKRNLLFIAVMLLVSAAVFGQSSTGILTGNVTTDGGPLPGATVTISSPSLQGVKTTVTGENGAYIFPALPPGRYTVTVELEGMATVERQVQVNLAQTAKVDVDLRVAAVAEAITVTASSPTTLETTAVSQNIDAKTLDNLPINRTILGAATLAPGVSPEGPNDQLMIAGAPSYENLYIVNGAVVNDSIRGQPESVFIEDAIAETTVLTGNISAEYGRFTGGVVNTITKSGGNEFSGSIRDSLENDDWTNKTPFPGEADKVDELNEVYEGTLGGFILRDRLWFFGAGRTRETTGSAETTATSIPFETGTEEDRYEIKLTGQITPSHSAVVSYLDRNTVQTGNWFGSITDLRSVDDRELPNTLSAISYSGILASNLLIEAQWSEREFAFVGSGADSEDLIEGTIIRDLARGYRAWSPTFCGICDDKTRNNEYLHLKSSYFLSTPSLGNHNIVAGYEDFSELRNENNQQGGSGWRVFGNFRYVGQETYLHVDPTASYIQVWPVLNESLTSDSNVKSFYVNDRWDYNENLSFNLGARYDSNDSVDQAGKKTSDDSAVSPRLSITYDLFGDGRHRFIGGYGEYVAEIDNGVNDDTSSAGSPALFSWNYRGPAINPPGTPDNQLVPTAEVLQQVFDWFFNTNCAGLANYQTCLENKRSFSLPGVSAQLEGALSSPTAKEWSLGYGAAIGSRGFVRFDYITREYENFYTDTTNLNTGKVTDDLGNVFDITLIGNNDAGLSREYDALTFQGGYRIMSNLNIGGNYTWSELRGNADSETSNNATITLTSRESYPEYISQSWNNPVRALTGDVEHRANLWVSYDLPTPIGNFNFSALERFHSGYAYYANGTISLSAVSNPGYEDAPSTATYFFEGDKDYRTDDVTRTDLAINYGLPIGPVEIFLQADVLNVFDEDAIADPSSVDSTVYTSRNSACRKADGTRCDVFNPMTTTPVEGVHYVKASTFGEASSAGAYQLPLTYQFSVGLRF